MVDREATQLRVRAIFAELRDSPDRSPELMDELVRLHVPLVTHIARRFIDRGEPLEDLIQVGMLALVKAAERFDPERGVEFSTFLTPTVLGEIKRHFRDHGWSVKVPRRAQELQAEVAAGIQSFSQDHGRAPSVSELAESTGLSQADVLTGLEAQHAYATVPIDAPSGAAAVAPSERIADPQDPFDAVEWQRSLGPLIAELPPREREILRMRFVDDMTQVQIASTIGVSQMHVSRLLARVLDQLRSGLERPSL